MEELLNLCSVYTVKETVQITFLIGKGDLVIFHFLYTDDVELILK